MEATDSTKGKTIVDALHDLGAAIEAATSAADSIVKAGLLNNKDELNRWFAEALKNVVPKLNAAIVMCTAASIMARKKAVESNVTDQIDSALRDAQRAKTRIERAVMIAAQMTIEIDDESIAAANGAAQ